MLSPEEISFALCQVALWSVRVNSRYSLFVFRDSFSGHVWVSHAHSHALSKKVWTNFLGITPEENEEDSKHTNGFVRAYANNLNKVPNLSAV